MRQLINSYLLLYNSAQALGWALAFFRILLDFSSTRSFNGAYASSGELIILLQKAAVLEVIHGALGIVPSGVLFSLMQWGGRTHYLLAIVQKIDEVQESPSIFATFVSWSICDFIRYTAFIPLYPLGAAGEVWLMYHALPYIREKDLYGDFFSYFPLSYYTFIQILLLCYPLCWGKLYVHLLKQRQSKLGKPHGKKRE